MVLVTVVSVIVTAVVIAYVAHALERHHEHTCCALVAWCCQHLNRLPTPPNPLYLCAVSDSQLFFAGFIISEANRLNGVWLLARCADLKQLDYSVANFHLCLLMLFVIGLVFRALALLGVYSLNRNRQV